MDWIWDNIQLILVVAGSIAVWLNQKRREQSGEPADYDEDGVPDNRVPPRPDARSLTPTAPRDGVDPEQAERVRRIQEEIRRKIAERRGQTAPSAPPPMPAPVFEREQPAFREERPAPPPLPSAREVVTAYDDEAALERQRRMADQLAELEARRREARRAAQALAETGGPTVTVRSMAREAAAGPAPIGARGLAKELRDPKALRRAMVLREVLDAPVALR